MNHPKNTTTRASRRAPGGRGAPARQRARARRPRADALELPVIAEFQNAIAARTTRPPTSNSMNEETKKMAATETLAPDIVENNPNAARTVESLRRLGYENYAALCDIVDNSYDAEASNIWITINRAGGDFVISVADDGVGMDKTTLDQALKLGSLTERDDRIDLGKFGMGLVTASMSIARRTTVYTRAAGGKVWFSQTDVDEIKRHDRFMKVLREASVEELDTFKSPYPESNLPEHGTLVVLDHSDNVSNTNTTAFKDTLRNRLAETYRYFIGSGRSIFLNGEKVAPFDPLMLEEQGTELFSDEKYEIQLKDAEGTEPKTHELRIRIAVLPEFSEQYETYRKVNQSNQGFYIVRNYRQISSGQTLGVFEKHNEYNRIRLEIFFSGELDEAMGVQFTKQSIEPTQQIRDRIREAVRGQISTIGDRLKKAKSRATPDRATEAHDEAAKVIGSKSALLIKPQVPVEQREKRERDESIPRRPPTTEQERKERRNVKRSALANRDLNTRFERVSLGRNGPIFESELVGKTVVIGWNVDHPFYEAFVLENADDKNVVSGIDFFVYSLASAMLKTKSDANIDILENIMAIMSSNMRVLLT